MLMTGDTTTIDKGVAFWEQIRRGDEQAFRQLYEQNADWLYGYGMKIAGDDALVTESIRTLFTYIFERRGGGAEPKSVTAYLCAGLRRILFDELGKDGEKKHLFDEADLNGCDFHLEIDIEAAVVRSELKKEQLFFLQKELDGLTGQQREVLYLKHYKGLNSDEITQVMRTASRITAVYHTVCMAISRLRERLFLFFRQK